MVYKSFFKDTVIYGLASVLPRVINLALVAVFTAVLDRVDFSDQTTWYVYAAFINVLLTMGIETSFFRYYTSAADKDKVLGSSFFIHLISSLVFLFAGLLLAAPAGAFLGFKNALFIRILVLTTVLDTLVVIPFALLRVQGRPVRYFVLKMANVLILALITVFLLVGVPWLVGHRPDMAAGLGFEATYSPGVFHIITANLIASLTTLFMLLPLLYRIGIKPDKGMVTQLLRYGWPIMVGGIAYAVNENVDKLLIQNLMDKESNGVYAACYKLGVFMTLYITAFRLGAEPFFFSQAHTSDAKQKYSTIMTWFVVFGSIFMLFVTGFIDILASIILRNKVYTTGLYIVPVILLANLFSGIYNNLSIWYKLTDRTRAGMYISILGGVITIVSLYLFVPFYGIMGGAIATLITYFCMAVISYFFGRKFYPVPYELPRIALIIGVSAFLSGLSFVNFRGNYTISTGLIAAFVIFVFLLQKEQIRKLR